MKGDLKERWIGWRADHTRGFKGCAAGWNCARERLPHKPCVVCGKLTCRKAYSINPRTLKRETVFVCNRYFWPNESACGQQITHGLSRLAKQRAENDARYIPQDVIVSFTENVMSEQWPCISRATLRAFLASKAEVATIDPEGASLTGLAGSIRSLGFSDDVYVEQRGKSVVLRKVTTG